MKKQLREGALVKITSDNESYDAYRDTMLRVKSIARSVSDHPGYDESMEGQALCDLVVNDTDQDVPFSLYEWEFEVQEGMSNSSKSQIKAVTKRDRGFHRLSRLYYADESDKRNLEVRFGIYFDDGSTQGVVSMKWIEFDGKLSPHLNCYCDGLWALASFTDLIEELGRLNDVDFTEEEFVELLKRCGFKDLTEYENAGTKVVPLKPLSQG